MTEQEQRQDAVRRSHGLEFERQPPKVDPRLTVRGDTEMSAGMSTTGMPMLVFGLYLALAACFCGWVMGKASPLARSETRGAR